MFKKIAILILFGIFISAYFWEQLLPLENEQQAAPSSDRASFVTVKYLKVKDTVTATGIIKPQVGSKVRVGSQISGVLEKLFVNVGGTVRKGQPLARLQNDEFLVRRNRAKAQLDIAAANQTFAEVNFERELKLAERRVTSEVKRLKTEHEFTLAVARYRLAESDLRLAQIDLDRTLINAPLKGVIESISTREGETVSANFSAPTFLTIIDLDRLEVWTYIDETDIGRIKVGQGVSFTVDTYSEASYEGTITAIRPQAVIEDNVVNYIAVVEYKNTDSYRLRPEMTAFIKVEVDKSKSTPVLPQTAVSSDKGQKFVWVQKNGKLEKQNIQTGKRFGALIEVTRGLKIDDKVAIVSQFEES